MSEKDLAHLIESVSNSLHAEMQAMQAEWRESADRIEDAVGRHSRAITSGTLMIGAINRSLTKHDKAIKDLQTRMRQLERRKR
jgi:type II secretory pathway component PulM